MTMALFISLELCYVLFGWSGGILLYCSEVDIWSTVLFSWGGGILFIRFEQKVSLEIKKFHAANLVPFLWKSLLLFN